MGYNISMVEEKNTGEKDGESEPTVKTDAGVEVVAPPARRRRSIVFEASVMVALAGFGVLAVFASSAAYFPFDLVITDAFQSFHPVWFQWLMRAVSFPGYPPQAWAFIIAPVVALYVADLRWEAVMLALVAIAEQVLNTAIKYTVQRPRPPASLVEVIRSLAGFSFPSGHVMFYTGFFGFLWFLSFVLLKRSWKRTVLLFLFGGLVLLIGPSRVYLGEHWPSDAFGAYLLGGIVLAVAIRAYNWGKDKYFVK